MADPKFRTEITADPALFIAGTEVATSVAQAASQAIEAAFAASARAMEATMKSVQSSITGALESIQHNFLGVVAVMGGGALGVDAFTAGIRHAIDFADELGKLSQKVGITVQDLQFLAYAADQSDVPMEGMVKALKKLSTTMFEAGTGSKEAAALFSGLKVEIQDASGKLKPTDEVLGQLADRFHSMEDGPTKAALAVKLFGREGLAMIPFLNQGRQGLEQLREQFKSVAGVIDDETAQAAEHFNQQLKTLGTASQKLKIELARSMMPALQDITRAMTEAAKEGGILYTLWIGLGGVAANLFGSGSVESQLGAVREKIADLKKQQEAMAWAPDTTKLALQRQMNVLLEREAQLVKELGTPAPPPAPKITPDLDDFNTTKTPKESALPKLRELAAAEKADFETRKTQRGEFQVYTLAMEIDFWRKIKDAHNLSVEDQTKVDRIYSNLVSQNARQGFEAQMDGLKAQAAAYKSDLDTRLAYAQRIADAEAKAWGPDSPQAQAALKAVEELKRQIAQRAAEITEIWAKAADDQALRSIEAQRSTLGVQMQMFQVSKLQELAQLQGLLQTEESIRLDAIQRQIDAEKAKRDEGRDYDAKKIAEMEAQKYALDQQYEQKRQQLDQQTALEMAKYNIQAHQAVQTSFEGLFSSVLKLDTSLQKMALNFWNSMSTAIDNIAAKMLAEKLFGPGGMFTDQVNSVLSAVGLPAMKSAGDATNAAAMSAAATMLNTAGTTLTTAGTELAGIVTESLSFSADMLTDAAVQLTAAAEAIVAAAGASGGGGAISAIASVAQIAYAAPHGFDVPPGLSPVTQLHPEEMVLPADLANRVRGFTERGASSSSGGGHTINIHGDMYGLDDIKVRIKEAIGAANSPFHFPGPMGRG
jgi:TP901 family phage tail tape measure protein